MHANRGQNRQVLLECYAEMQLILCAKIMQIGCYSNKFIYIYTFTTFNIELFRKIRDCGHYIPCLIIILAVSLMPFRIVILI